MFENLNANQMGLLQTGLAILSNAYGPNARNAIGIGGMQGLQAMQQAKANEQDEAYRKMQVKALEAKTRQSERQAQMQDQIAGLFGLGAPQQPALLAQGMASSDAGPALLGGGQPVQGPGLAGLDLNQVAAIKAMGGPDLMDAWKYSKEGIERKQGSTYIDPLSGQERYMPELDSGIVMQNGQAAALPGYAQAQAEIEAARAGATTGAQQAAQYPYDLARLQDTASLDLVDVPDGKGGIIKMPRSQAVAALGGQAPAAAPGALGTQESPEKVAARQDLPQVEQKAEQMLSSIEKVISHPGRAWATGASGMLPTVPGSQSADFVAELEQLQGQAFLQAFQSLKGGGAITEIEGKKAEQAIANLTRTRSEEGFLQALNELKEVISTGVQRAREKAGISTEPSAAPAAASGDFSSLWGG